MEESKENLLEQHDAETEINIVIAGHSGSGKSFLINFFKGLDQDGKIPPSDPCISCTKESKIYKTELKGRIIRKKVRLFDTQGIFDTEE